ncbi:MAG: Rrf2 family transcriptional regulator [Candidatus Cloacimonetes bacterium]|nr:Rrf2 family transcriptional regulator [Candidatus Cloacimonadota bacterium]
MRFSKKLDYSILLMSELVHQHGVVASSTLAEKLNLSNDLVSLLLKNLARHNLLTSTRGKNGGYSLTLPPEKITLKDVTEAVDGPIALTQCASEQKDICSLSSVCSFQSVLVDVSHRVEDLLAEVSLQTLIDQSQQAR